MDQSVCACVCVCVCVCADNRQLGRQETDRVSLTGLRFHWTIHHPAEPHTNCVCVCARVCDLTSVNIGAAHGC